MEQVIVHYILSRKDYNTHQYTACGVPLSSVSVGACTTKPTEASCLFCISSTLFDMDNLSQLNI